MMRLPRIAQDRRDTRRLVGLLLVLLVPLAGCESTPKAEEPGAIEEDVKLGDLAGPKRHMTLDDLLPESSSTVALAVPEGLEQPAITQGDLTGGTTRLKAEIPPEHTGDEEAAEEAAAAERQARHDELPLDLRSDADAAGDTPAPAADADSDDDDEEAEASAEDEPDVPRRVRVRLLVFRHPDPRVGRAMDMLEDGLPEEQQQAWEENGFFVGEVARNRLPLFMANLPRELSHDVFTLHRVNAYWPLTLIDRLRGPQHVEVVNPDEATSDHRRLVGGKFQMLIKLVPSIDRDRRRVYLDLLPHHRGVRAELLPRSPKDRVLDGRSFDTLRLYEPLSTQRVWVVAADLPLEEEADEDEVGTAGDVNVDEPSANEPEHAKLGHAMMHGRHRGKQVQMVLLIIAD